MPLPQSDLASGGKLRLGLLLVLAFLMTAILAACGTGAPPAPASLSVTPRSGPPGTILTVTGLTLGEDEAFQVWLGPAEAPARPNDDGTLAVAVPLFLGDDGWPEPPSESLTLEVRRDSTVLGRSGEGIAVTELEPAPGSTRKIQVALAQMTLAFENLLAVVPPSSEEHSVIQDGLVAMLNGLASEGDMSLKAVLDGTSPALEGEAYDASLMDALLASSGAVDYFEAYAEALQGASAAALRTQSMSPFCRGTGADFELACQLQIHSVLDEYSRSFVKPTAETYANTVGLALGLVAIGGVVVPANVIVGAILSVADFVMEKIAPALFPARVTKFELEMPETTIEVGDSTQSRILVTAVNNPPSISYLDVIDQVRTIMGVKDLKTDIDKSFTDVLQGTATYVFDLYLKLVKAYESKNPGSHPWVTAGDIRIPSMTWGPVEVTSADLVTLFSFDESVVASREDELEWEALDYGEARVRVMPRGPGDRSKVLRDNALCLGCVYYGGAFGSEMPESSVTVKVGQIELSASPAGGQAPATVTFSWAGIEPQEEPIACILDVGDGSTFYSIADCAGTTSQSHTYSYTSALLEGGAYVAELKLVGREKSDTVEVDVGWRFTASPTSGDFPLDVTFSWSGFDPQGGSLSCTLEPGDGSPVKVIDDCLGTTSTTHRFVEKGAYTPTLIVSGGAGSDFRSAAVTVTEAASCEDAEALAAVQEWTGRTFFDFVQSAVNGDSSVHVERHADFSFTLGERTEYVFYGELHRVTWRKVGSVSGTASMYDTYNSAYWSGDELLQTARVELEVDLINCDYSFEVALPIRATHPTAGESTHHDYLEVEDEPLTAGTGWSESRSLPSVYHWRIEVDSPRFRFLGGYGSVLGDWTGNQFDEAQGGWTIEPVGP